MPVLVALGAAAFLSTVVMRMTEPVVGEMAAEFGVAPSALAILATAYALPYALFQLVFGPLGDRFGKVRIVRLALAVLAVTIAATALAPDFRAMAVVRFLSGVFGGAIIPLGLAAIGDRFALPERQVMLSRFMMATLSGQVTGAFLTGVFAEFLPWRTVFLGYAVLAGLVAAGLFTVPRAGVVSAEPLTVSGVVRRYLGILKGRKARTLLPIVFVEGALFFGFVAFSAPYLSEARGLSPGEIGLVVAAYGVGGILFSLVVRPLLATLGPYGMILAGGLVAGAGAAAFSFAWALATYAALSGAIGFSFSLIHNNLQTRATELAPETRGSSVAIFACTLFIGNAMGPLVLKGFVLGVGYGAMFQGLGLTFALFGMAAAGVLRARERGAERMAPAA